MQLVRLKINKADTIAAAGCVGAYLGSFTSVVFSFLLLQCMRELALLRTTSTIISFEIVVPPKGTSSFTT